MSIITSKALIILMPGPELAIKTLAPDLWSSVPKAKPRPE